MLVSLTTVKSDVNYSNMKAMLLMRDKIALDDDSFVELVVWKLPRTLPGSTHDFEYRLAFVNKGVCVIRYDNEAGKGDHRHLDELEVDYSFAGLEQLQCDFWDDVEQWRRQ